MQDAELLGQHYGRLYERYKHMEQKYRERCNENAQLSLLRQNCLHLDSDLGKTHDKIDVFRNAANENEKLYIQYTRNSAQSADKLKKGVKDWNDMLQSEMKK
ncbi:hypothetical protein WUBG_03141 [Wuchereria bancrofti]|uniref:Uncharacterized protein n=1 Tax=Wuchereria bancrofti TaxID=6293 RepID=J9FF20_WUCBA|nr:hypothetical protein WUBG_03141 [Wuchereria bancrofti]